MDKNLGNYGRYMYVCNSIHICLPLACCATINYMYIVEFYKFTYDIYDEVCVCIYSQLQGIQYMLIIYSHSNKL